ncbi:MAG: hypothetical protein JWP88_896 [Flaviaesturariibacter sp.]|nr:hypothetical protein [Flaviaesturariibacter sp.]
MEECGFCICLNFSMTKESIVYKRQLGIEKAFNFQAH